MKKPRQKKEEIIPELTELPYHFYEEVDYKRIMALQISAVRIDSKNERATYEQKLKVRNEKLGPTSFEIKNNQSSTSEDNMSTEEKNCNDSSECSEDIDDTSFKGPIDTNIVYVCGLIINIVEINKSQILKLRKLMPKRDYRQLKNRKSARECRKKRKNEREVMKDELEELKLKNQSLNDEIEQLKAALANEKRQKIENEKSVEQVNSNLFTKMKPLEALLNRV